MAKSDISAASTRTNQALQTAENLGSQYGGLAGTGYGTFAQTGGVTGAEQAQTRSMAQKNVGAIYGAMQKNLARQKAIQGGYSPGYGAGSAQLARQGSAAASDAVTGANLGLLQQIRQGQLAGLGGLSGLAGMYQGQVPELLGTQAKLAMAKPAWWQSMIGGEQAIEPILSGVAGGFGG